MRSSSPSSWLSRLVHTWKHLQVTYYGGKYSIQRLLSLETYTKNTSLVRVVLVCIGTPLPMVLVISIQALVPLQDPTEGWRANYGFWIRSGILSFVVAHTLTNQATYLINGVAISAPRLIFLSACTAIMFTAFAIVMAAVLIFPVPFFVLTLSPLFYVALVISFRFLLGTHVLREMLSNRGQLIRYICFVAAQNVLVFTYPAYETLFRIAKGSFYQLPVILLLPFIKIAVKNVVLRCMVSMEDMLPEAVIFTVDFFNSIYIATCMQSASSASAVVAITITDFSQTLVVLYGLHQRVSTILLRLRNCMDNNAEGDNIVNALCWVCRHPKNFASQTRTNILTHSCLPGTLSAENMALLERLGTLSPGRCESSSLIKLASAPSIHDVNTCGTKTKHKVHRVFVQKRSDAVHPSELMQSTSGVKTQSAKNSKNVPTQHSTTILSESLEALFTIECIVVAAYLETIVPLFYCCYMVVMVHLPSARYHTEMAFVTVENVGATIVPVFVFGLLQIATFLMLAVVIKRYCGMVMTYQLAFVLETQMPLIQGKLILWLLITLCFRVAHFGTPSFGAFSAAFGNLLSYVYMRCCVVLP